jgi:hypothetical protein
MFAAVAMALGTVVVLRHGPRPQSA